MTIPKTCIPVVSAIIERKNLEGELEVLVQERWKPDSDPVYSGTLEIPAGWIDEYEDVHEALKREVKEETGLTVTKIKPDSRTRTISGEKEDGSFAFVPFCCQQQIKGGHPWIGFVFLCEVEGEIVPQDSECRNVRWLKKHELKEIFDETPEQVFTLQLGVLDYYFSQ